MEIVVTRGFGGAPLRPRPFQRGKRLGRPAGSEQAAADLAPWWGMRRSSGGTSAMKASTSDWPSARACRAERTTSAW
jgi:hypothetical protein